MSRHEEALVFPCASDSLVGILSRRAGDGHDTGVVIVVGGPQYRAGSHRQFVTLARALAHAGFAVLRFDCSGMGDSTGKLHTFEHISADIGTAIGALMAATPELKRVVLWGLCDGASAALLYLHGQPDARVAGLALLNPWVRSEASLAKTHVKHYYRQRLMERAFWLKLFRGKVAISAVQGLLRNLRASLGTPPASAQAAAPYQERMAMAWAAFEGQTLLMLSQNDYTAREFVEYTVSSAAWRQALALRPPQRIELAGADHTCSQPAAQRAVEDATKQWLGSVS